MPTLTERAQHVMEAAKKIYEGRLRAQLEPEHLGEVIAIEPESGEYVLARTFRQLDLARQARFGTRMVYTFRVGGDGAVSIEGGKPHGRIAGRA